FEAANRSIHAAVYVVKYDPGDLDDPVNALLQSLVEAKSRGLDVRVLVDEETNSSYRQTITYLCENGVPVKLDRSSGVTTHTKIVIIDGRYLIVGSHNWTESALNRNHEYSTLLKDSLYAQEADAYFQTLWDEGRSP
ncbi:MAG: phospholipase D-like domain-containing protein, partial [Candidatus Bathyarchaeia archaeon]